MYTLYYFFLLHWNYTLRQWMCLSILGYNTIYFIPFGCTHPISTMTRFRRSFASKSFGLSDRARIRDDDKFHAACLLACTDRNFLGEKERQTGGRQRGSGQRASIVDRQRARIHGHLEKCPNFHFLPRFVSSSAPSAARLPFREGVNTAQGWLGSNYRLNFIGNVPQGRFTRLRKYTTREN